MSWIWKLARRELELGACPLVMGILNVTPDSFSDGGRYLRAGAAIEHAHALVADGADIIDIGGESTRPGARAVSPEEETERVLPVIEALAGTLSVPLSVDTQKAAVAEAALAAGAEIVNDVSGLRADARMATVVARARAGLVAMHMRGTPETMQTSVAYDDLFGEVRAAFEDVFEACGRAGIDRAQVVLDPGIGFGKRLEHNLALLANPDAFASFDRPLLVGLSRKSMFRDLLGLAPEDREEATLAGVAISVFLGVSIVRVHEVRAAVRAVGVAHALRRARAGDSRCPEGARA